MSLPEPYLNTANDYLKRARVQLDSNKLEAVFYAALELRFSIEARLKRYHKAYLKITQLMSKKKEWKIAKLAGKLESAYANWQDKTLVFKVLDRETDEIIIVLEYIPVSKKLQNMGEKLGALLHAIAEYKPVEDVWWEEKRKFLESVYSELERVLNGKLMCIPLRNSKTGSFHIEMEFDKNDQPSIEAAKKAFIPNSNVKIQIHTR